MNKAVVIPAVLAAGIACAPLAQADNDTYLQYLISHGVVEEGNGPFGGDNLVRVGHNACAAFQQGASDLSQMGQIIQTYQTGKAQAEDIVYAAHHYLCP
jgi:Protein of unknown function (DUF732)